MAVLSSLMAGMAAAATLEGVAAAAAEGVATMEM